MDDWLTNLGIFGIMVSGVSTVAVFLAKAIIRARFSKDLEKFKAALKRAAFEHQTRYAKLHDERAEIIKELYSRLVSMSKSCQLAMSPSPTQGVQPQGEKDRTAIRDTNEFIDYYQRNRIIFGKDTCAIIDDIVDKVLRAWRDFLAKDNAALEPTIIAGLDVMRKAALWANSWETISDAVPAAKQKLEDDFRKLLGVDSCLSK